MPSSTIVNFATAELADHRVVAEFLHESGYIERITFDPADELALAEIEGKIRSAQLCRK